MSNSGVRVGEMRNLRWDDVSSIKENGTKHYVLRVSGKTGERDVVLNPYSDKYLKRVYNLRTSELGHPPSPTEHVFLSRKTGKPYTSFKTSFNSMLKWNAPSEVVHQLGYDYPVLGGLNDGWKTRKAGRYRAEASAG
jgi:integrase